MKILFCILFALAAALHLYGCFPPQKRKIKRGTKPFLMPLLIGCVASFINPPPLLLVIALALFLVMDSLLIFPDKQLFLKIAYLAGAAGFALYAFTFLIHLGTRPSFLFIAIAIVVYGALMTWYLYLLAPYLAPGLAPFVSAILCLGTLSSLMALFFAFTNAGAAPKLVFAGSVLILVAGVAHTLHQFRKHIRFGVFSQMLLYIAGQALVIFGLIGFGGI